MSAQRTQQHLPAFGRLQIDLDRPAEVAVLERHVHRLVRTRLPVLAQQFQHVLAGKIRQVQVLDLFRLVAAVELERLAGGQIHFLVQAQALHLGGQRELERAQPRRNLELVDRLAVFGQGKSFTSFFVATPS